MPDALTSLDILRTSHGELVAVVDRLDADDLRTTSYCTEWSVAQVLSHLGSGSEIYDGMVRAVVAGDDPPGRDAMGPIWDRWNAMTPDEQAVQWRVSVERFLEDLGNIPPELLESGTFSGPMGPMPVAMLPTMRVGEQVLHTWDVAVAFNPEAVVLPAGVEVLVDQMPMLVGRSVDAEVAKELGPQTIAIHRSDSDTWLTLGLGDEVTLTPGEPTSAETTLTLPAESLVRLVWGRLGPGTSSETVLIEGALDLDDLRRLFPGR